jgi:hypothetical protein
MNRFVAYTVLAVAALALAANSDPTVESDDNREVVSQFSLVTNDEDETTELRKNNLGVFADFCKSSRDHVLTDLKHKSNNQASQTFTDFFSIVKDIAKKSLEAQDAASERLAVQLANPSAEVNGDDEVAEYQRKVAQSKQPAGLYQAVVGVASSVSQTFVHYAKEKINEMKANAFNGGLYKEAAKTACDYARQYEEDMAKQFAEYKKENLEGQRAYEQITFEEVPCTTAGRIRKLNLFCQLFEQSGNTLFRLLGRSQTRQVELPEVDV